MSSLFIFILLWSYLFPYRVILIPFTKDSNLHTWNIPFIYYYVGSDGSEGITIDVRSQIDSWTRH